MSREKLQKRRQELYSWNWFYQNNLENLAASRYYKIKRTVTDKITGESKLVMGFPYINDDFNKHMGNSIHYSKRFKEDKISSEKCDELINKIK